MTYAPLKNIQLGDAVGGKPGGRCRQELQLLPAS
jgi:hypothetical protein